ncbi:MAG: putative toxin-antitoxin system toxin component, PIN family [bacterium]|nr:putative toxin-antitoxin system toxin component, PIN family [bacterium]
MPAFKAVIDTSVMVSVAFAMQGLAKELKDMIADEDFTLVTSKQILKELYQVLHYPRIIKRFSASEDDINEFIGLIVEKAFITEGRYSADGITEDPADDMFIACALEAEADYIIARDPHLRNLKHFHGIQIIDVSTFIKKVQQE